MIKYIIKRILIGALTLFILATITFFGVHYMPGNPFEQDNKRMTQAQYDSLNEKFGLDKPLGTQYVMFLSNAVKGDFGESIFKKNRQVNEIIATEFVPTAKLGAVSFVVAITLGLTLGIIGALTKKKWLNSVITMIASIGVSIPSFLFAMIMMVLFGVTWKLLPVSGLDTPIHYILPASALALNNLSMVTRLTRQSLRDEMHKDYITLGRSKGLSDRRVTIKHGLKNALLPVITHAGPMFANAITGSLVIENLFTIHGIGKEFSSSITNRDYPLVMGLTIFFGALVIVMNLVSDITSAIVDPRIKLGK
ncbi:MAG: ABC transporter permease [Oscillospiraceae bacterium]|nr:ABC transporter permease [Oscillospiraceae bacterium]MBQ5343501.1 ABC transporter permease [Oscillospiraceae bacterium]